MSACEADAPVLGKLLLVQGVLDALPHQRAQAELLCRALQEVPGVAGIHFCLRGTVIPPHPSCNPDCSFARSGYEASADTTSRCWAFDSPQARRFSLETTERLYGLLVLLLDAEDRFAPYAPHLTNIANFLAVHIEKRERTEELVRVNRSLVEENLERRRAEEALRQAEHRKDEFLAMLGHELRNPLAPIRHSVEILRIKGGAMPELSWAIDVIDRQAEHLTRLVDDLLDVSRITQGKIRLQKEPVELRTIASRAVEASRPFINARQHQLTVTYPESSLCLEGDVVRLTQIVSNLLNNAAKYTPERGRIWLVAEREGEAALLRVKDTGVGISAEHLPHVFELFMQAHPSLDRSAGGLGIGLTVVKLLVEMHGGSIRAFSDGPGLGSEFVVSLPLLVEQRSSGTATAVERSPPAGRWRLLVADDNVDAAKTLALLFEIEGHEVHVAFDGFEALQAAQRLQPHAIFLDIGLPGMDGYEVARRLRRQTAPRRPLLVAISGYGQEEDRRASEAAGIDHHLVKPVDWRVLQNIMIECSTRSEFDVALDPES